MHIGKKIKLLRNIKNITQDELAEKINKTRALVSHIEQTGKVNHYTLTLVLKALNLSFADFESFDDKQALKNTSVSPITNDELNALKNKIEYYQKENTLLMELVASQKKVIEVLENKKKVKKK